MKRFILDILESYYSKKLLTEFGYSRINSLINSHLKAKHSIEYTYSSIIYSIRVWSKEVNY